MTHCFPCSRSFQTPSALRLHLKTSSAHPYCPHCDMGFQTDAGYISHCKSKHNPECRPCHHEFRTWDELQEHWRTAEAHAKCQTCNIGFEEYGTYVKHMRAQHAATSCSPCSGMLISKNDLASHYLNSPRHPTCSTCHIGFLDDTTYSEHARTTHAASCCRPCSRHFDTISLLHEHYTQSPAHPSCSKCSIGFSNDAILQDHEEACFADGEAHSHQNDHNDTTPTKLTPSTRASRMRAHNSTPSEADLTDMVNAFITPSPSPAKPRHDIGLPPFVNGYQNSPLVQVETLSPGQPSSDPGASPLRHGVVTNGVGASPMQREISEMSELDLATAAFGSPAASPRITHDQHYSRDISPSPQPNNVPYIAIQDATADFSDDESDIGSAPVPAPNWDSARVPQLLAPDILRLRLSAAARARETLESGSESGISTPTAADTYASTAGTSVRSRSASPFSGSTDSSPFAYPAHTHVGSVDGKKGSPSPVKRAGSIGMLYCRVCGQDPCDAPTATMCGHVFCKGCIEDEVMRHSKCPVCSQAVLLYCLWRLHVA